MQDAGRVKHNIPGLTDAPPASTRPRLDYLDGLRGLAALYVVFHHVWQLSSRTHAGGALPRWFRFTTVLSAGHYAVAVFIVLSGFCLMLPVVNSPDGRIPGGLFPYLKRRSRRILPPYYAAMVLSLLAIGLIPGLRRDDGTIFSLFHEHSMRGAILAHLFMVHNLDPGWIFRIDGPMWSVATEYQIYFLFPLILLPLWRRFGVAAPVTVGFLIGVATIPLHVADACFWYIGLFAAGMAAAVTAFSPPQIQRKAKVPWILLSLVCLAGVHFGSYFGGHVGELHSTPVGDLMVGLSTGCLLIACANAARQRDAGACSIFARRVLSARIPVRLGHFSYSLYLIHFPLVLGLQCAVARLGLPASTDFLALAATAVPLSLLLSYLFHLAVERPFMSPPARRTTPVGNALPLGVNLGVPATSALTA